MSDSSKAILIAGATELYDLLAPHTTQWAIYASGTSDEAILPDSFAELSFKGDSRISTYPVEKGAFSSYNKVQTPESLRLRLTCMNKLMGRDDFLQQLRHMKNSTDKYDVATPDAFYENMTVTSFDYKRSAKDGATMITAEVVMEEIRETGAATYSLSSTSAPTINSDSPSAASQKNAGTATVSAPSPAELLALQRGIQ
jgi:hypothetical protein